jgi:DNA repair exonuclease SbcCD ATPase subunit
MIDTTNLDNPYIQVIWEDYNENFTQEKIKSVRQYFQKKYNSNNVNIITKTKSTEGVETNVDVSFNILDKNYQLELIKSFLSAKGLEDSLKEVINLDKIVDEKINQMDLEITPFKKWYIKNVEFSNFLSYGENQKIDFESKNGITVIESDPKNFGGKTVLSLDLLLFLFFNETTKTSKSEEIFNRYTNKNKVYVKGEITIDGDDYIIVRVIERKRNKNDEWNIKTELEFFKKLSDGSLINFTGEQRRETEKFIKRSIGTKEDFLMTILTTSSNLEDLIDSKPTARGQILSRFLGLDYLKTKEDVSKQIYNDFASSMMSRFYNSERLKQENDDFLVKIDSYENENVHLNDEIFTLEDRIIKGQDYRDSLLKSKHTDIDKELVILSPEKLTSEINIDRRQKDAVLRQIENIKVIEPSNYYYEINHDKIKEDYKKLFEEKIILETKINDLNELSKNVSGGIKCGHCGIELINAEITKNKLSELASLIKHKDEILVLLNDLSDKDNSFIQLKKEFDEYEKNKLIKEKYEITVESYDIKIKNNEEKLQRFHNLKDKIKENERIETLIIKAGLKLDEINNLLRETKIKLDNNFFHIRSIKEKIKNNLEIIEKITKESEKEKLYKIYLDIFGKNGISKIIMKTMMPLINSELYRLLENSSEFRLEIRLNDKNEVEFYMIDNNSQVEKLMTSGSGYERTIASLALRSVLAKICSLPKPNIIVMDEVFGKVSDDNLDLVGEFFQKIKEYFEKIFIITHNPLINNWADNVVKIKKVENVSYVVK